MKNCFKKQCVKDSLTIIGLIVLYNLYITISYDTWEHMNPMKVIGAFIGGSFVFVPMYLIIWATLRKLKSEFWFLIVSVGVWLIEPIFVTSAASETFNAWQGGDQIIKNGELTLRGYVHWLEGPFLFLAIYAIIVFALHLYRKIKKSTGETKL